MTDFTKPHGSQDAASQTAERRPWKAPRLIDLDDDDAKACRGGVGGDGKQAAMTESSDIPSCYFDGDPAVMIAS